MASWQYAGDYATANDANEVAEHLRKEGYQTRIVRRKARYGTHPIRYGVDKKKD